MGFVSNKVDVLEKFFIKIFAEGVLLVVNWFSLGVKVQIDKHQQLKSQKDKNHDVATVSVLLEFVITGGWVTRCSFQGLEYEQKNDWDQFNAD